MYAVSQSRHAKFLSPEINVAQPKTDSSDFISWDVIGPFTCEQDTFYSIIVFARIFMRFIIFENNQVESSK